MKHGEIKQLDDPFEVLDGVLRRGDAQRLGQRMHVSAQLIRNWCRPPETDEEYLNTGRPGPLQRLNEIVDYVIVEDGSPERAYPIGHHVARRLAGVFVPLPPFCHCKDSEMLQHVSAVLKETSEALEVVRVSWCEETPGRITEGQGKRIGLEIEQTMVALQALARWVNERTEK